MKWPFKKQAPRTLVELTRDINANVALLTTAQGQTSGLRSAQTSAEATFAPFSATYDADKLAKDNSTATVAAAKGALIAKLNALKSSIDPAKLAASNIDAVIHAARAATTAAEVQAFVASLPNTATDDFKNVLRPFAKSAVTDATLQQFGIDIHSLGTDYENNLTTDEALKASFDPKKTAFQNLEIAKHRLVLNQDKIDELDEKIRKDKAIQGIETGVEKVVAAKLAAGVKGYSAKRARGIITPWHAVEDEVARRASLTGNDSKFTYDYDVDGLIIGIRTQRPTRTATGATITPAAPPPYQVNIRVIKAFDKGDKASQYFMRTGKNAEAHIDPDAHDDAMVASIGAMSKVLGTNTLHIDTKGRKAEALRWMAVAQVLKESDKSKVNVKIAGVRSAWIHKLRNRKEYNEILENLRSGDDTQNPTGYRRTTARPSTRRAHTP